MEEADIVSGALMIFASFRVTPLALLMITPPEPLNVVGKEIPVTCAAEPLYCKVAAAPNDGAGVPAVVAVPSIERIPLIVVAAV